MEVNFGNGLNDKFNHQVLGRLNLTGYTAEEIEELTLLDKKLQVSPLQDSLVTLTREEYSRYKILIEKRK